MFLQGEHFVPFGGDAVDEQKAFQKWQEESGCKSLSHLARTENKPRSCGGKDGPVASPGKLKEQTAKTRGLFSAWEKLKSVFNHVFPDSKRRTPKPGGKPAWGPE